MEKKSVAYLSAVLIFITWAVCLSGGVLLAENQAYDTTKGGAQENHSGALTNNSKRNFQIPLLPEGAGPARANGSVRIEAGPAGESQRERLSLKIEGLGPGTYTLAATKSSGVEPIFLGVIVISDPTAARAPRPEPSRKQDNSTHQGEVLISHTEMILPKGVNGKELERIVVYGSADNIVLSGRRTP